MIIGSDDISKSVWSKYRGLDLKKCETIAQIIPLMAKLRKDKSWLADELMGRKSTAGLPIARAMDLLTMLFICPDSQLTRILAILKGLEFDHGEIGLASITNGSPRNDQGIATDFIESLALVLYNKVKGHTDFQQLVDRIEEEKSKMRDLRELQEIPRGDPALSEAALRAYLYIGFNPTCTISEIGRGTRLGRFALFAVTELVARRVVLDDFGHEMRRYFVPYFSEFLKRIAGYSEPPIASIHPNSATHGCQAPYSAALDRLIGRLVYCLADLCGLRSFQEARSNPALAGSRIFSSDADPTIAAAQYSGTSEHKIITEILPVIAGNSLRAHPATLLTEIPDEIFKKWWPSLSRRDMANSSAAGSNGAASSVAFEPERIGWIYDKAGIAPPSQVQVARSLFEFYDLVVEEAANHLLPKRAQSPSLGATFTPAELTAFQNNQPVSEGTDDLFDKAPEEMIVGQMAIQTLLDRVQRLRRISRAGGRERQQEEIARDIAIMRMLRRRGIRPGSTEDQRFSSQFRRQLEPRLSTIATADNWQLMRELRLAEFTFSAPDLELENCLEFVKSQFENGQSAICTSQYSAQRKQSEMQKTSKTPLRRLICDQGPQIGTTTYRRHWAEQMREAVISQLATLALRRLPGLAWPDNRLACFHYLKEIGALDAADFDKYFELLIYHHGIWDIYLTKDAAIVCLSPTGLLLDQGGRLHSTTEPAVQWVRSNCERENDDSKAETGVTEPDLYFLHGARFTKDLWEAIVQSRMNCHDIVKLQNMEQRVAALRIYGPDRILKELKGKRISKSERGNELYSIRNIFGADNEAVRLLKYRDPSTDRVYVSFVPEVFEDADDAMAWKFGLTKEEYDSLEVET